MKLSSQPETHEQKLNRLTREHRVLREKASGYAHATLTRQCLEKWNELQAHIKSRYAKKV